MYVVPILSYSQTFVKYPGFHTANVRTRTFHLEIIPCKELVECEIAFTLSHHMLNPHILHLFIRIDLKKKIDFVQVEMNECKFYQHVIWNTAD